MKNGKDSQKVASRLSLALSLSAVILLGGILCIFLFLYVKVSGGFVKKHAVLLRATGTAVVSVFTAFAAIFALKNKGFVFKLAIVVMVFATVALVTLYLLNVTGFWYKISSVEELRAYIKSFGFSASVILVVLQFLQVTFLPLPGVVATGAAVALFGPLKGGLLSFVGIYIGSATAFFIGRKIGYKAAAWLVGEDNLSRAQAYIKGKDKPMLTLMFLLPFFPDDVLCFVAGLSTVSSAYFLLMVFFTRLISVFLTAYSLNGNLIPYDKWWGILIWVCVFLLTAAVSLLVYKKNKKKL